MISLFRITLLLQILIELDKAKVLETLAEKEAEVVNLQRLKLKPWPKTVDPAKPENSLSDEEFLDVFKCTKEVFYKYPGWKQRLKRKDNGIF